MNLHGIKLTWLGHATFRIETPGGSTLIVDPWIRGNPACPAADREVKKVDVLLCTHGHGDHIGDAVEIIEKHDPKVMGIFELCAWLQKKGAKQTLAMNKGGTQAVDDIRVTMVHADHSCGIQDGDQIIYGGEACGYIIRLPGGLTIYHAGDTAVFGDMKIIAELYAPDLAMLPVGDHFTMGPREAALAIRMLNVRHVIPMHFGTFPLLTGNPEQLRQLTQDISGLEIHTLKPGESLGDSSAKAAS